ncbi:MAG: type II toxin-antitoxin system VapC family toxin, partial [Gammaproteobacteria bacterium]
CREVLKGIREPLYTTVPVLTEVFHMLSPASIGSDRLREFILQGGLSLWFLGEPTLDRVFELMEHHADHTMDLADASIVIAAEVMKTRKVFTVDRNEFETYRINRGHRHVPFEIIG